MSQYSSAEIFSRPRPPFPLRSASPRCARRFAALAV